MARWVAVAVMLTVGLAAAHDARAQTALISRDSVTGGVANRECRTPRVSADGRRVVFVSKATNLVAGDSSGKDHIYLWDARTPGVAPRILRISQANDGTPANGPSENPSISPDGDFVAFNSTATNLGNPAAGGLSNVYVHTIDDPDGAGPATGRITHWTSRAPGGAAPNGHCGRPSMSDVGLVAFECMASNMVAGDSNGLTDVFVGTYFGINIQRVSTNSSGGQTSGGYSFWPSISADGNLIAFMSYADNLVPNDGNHTNDVFVKDRRDNRVRRINTQVGTEPRGSSYAPAISADGKYVAFESDAWNMVPGFTEGRITRIYRVALDPTALDDTHRLVSKAEGGVHASINGDGSRVAYEAGDQIFFWDAQTTDTTLNLQLSTTTSGAAANGAGNYPALSPSTTENYVAWSSAAGNLDGSTGTVANIFVRLPGRTVRWMSTTTVVADDDYDDERVDDLDDFGSRVEVEGTSDGDFGLLIIANFLAMIELSKHGPGAPLSLPLAAPTVTVGGVPATGVSTPDSHTLVFNTPRLRAGTSNVVVVHYADGEVLTLPRPLIAAARVPGSATDTDADGLPDWWELTWGLDPSAANAATADSDGDGLTDAQEYATGHHPLGLATRYLAEGATGTMFLTRLALANPGALPAHALVRYLKKDGTVVTQTVPVPATGRATIDVETVSGMGTAEFATTVESDLPVVVDRTMRWSGTGRYGSHAERSVPAPATTWYLAEGATHSGFDLFYLLQNPGTSAATVEVRYLLPSGAPIVRGYTVPASSRANIWVDLEDPALAATDVSAVITSTNGVPIIVERAMYRSGAQMWAAGHESAGVTAPATHWFLAEGNTGRYFDLFILIANPGAQAAAVTATYLLQGGETVTKHYAVAPTSRFNVWVDFEDAKLADAAVSTTIASDVPVIVERAMWWPGDFTTWHEAHNSPGSTVTATRWGLAEGEVGGEDGAETYILLANTSAFAGRATVTLLFEDGTTTATTVDLAPNSRTNVAVREVFGAAVANKRFGAVIESLAVAPNAAAQLAVERAMYTSAGGVAWSAGTNALATPLP